MGRYYIRHWTVIAAALHKEILCRRKKVLEVGRVVFPRRGFGRHVVAVMNVGGSLRIYANWIGS